jgi:acetyl-CoA carboxylase biotin carboxyl carrier protein
VDLSPDDVRDVLRVLDSSALDELHLELDNLTLTVRREGATGWTVEQRVLRRPVLEGDAEPAGAVDQRAPRAPVPEGLAAVHPPLLGTF